MTQLTTSPITTRVKPTPAQEAMQREVDLLERLDQRIAKGDTSPYVRQCRQLTLEIIARMDERARLNMEYRRK